MIVERPALERRVVASLDAGRIPVVLGGCGTGRTSLLLRLERLDPHERRQYIDFAAVATTPERCLASVLATSKVRPSSIDPVFPSTARGAFDGLLQFFDGAATDTPATFLIDEILDARTFESFPGLRHVQREIVARLPASPARFVLASRFTARVHRLLRDAPARFEVIHMPALDLPEVVALALASDGGRRDWAAHIAPAVRALAVARVTYVQLLLEGMAALGPSIDPVAAMAALFAPEGRLTARCRESYEFRLHRARGYGALKAILGILAELEPLTLTEISHRLHRTPGSTKDYLSWLEDVDLITAQGKRYSFEDPMLRVYVRLYGRGIPPTDDDIVREVHAFAHERLPKGGEVRLPPPVVAPADRPVAAAAAERDTGIIEID